VDGEKKRLAMVSRRALGILLGLIIPVAMSMPPSVSTAAVPIDSQGAAVRSQLSSLAWPIRTATPDGNLDDLQPLGDAIGDARIVGLGEATHGTSEFFSLKDRILRYLVERKGFTVFAMEIPRQDGLSIDDYVAGGKGNVRDLLANTFPVWDNQEVADLIEWMRSYNAAAGSRPKLHFVGIDAQGDPARDRSMAENVERCSNVSFPNARVALWAHNAHVMVGAVDSKPSMGSYLRAAFGSKYYVVGFAFDSGTVSPNGFSQPMSFAPPPPTAIESVLATAGLPMYGLNLRTIPASSPLGAFLAGPKPMRMVGSIDTAAEAADNRTLMHLDVGSAFDTLVFVDRSHAAASFRVPPADPSAALTPSAQTRQPAGSVELTGQQILDKAVDVWESEPLPAFEAFTLPCHEVLRTGAEGTCGSSTQMRVYVRTSDGMAHVETIPVNGGKPTVLLPTGHMYGPAYAPLGFTRKWSYGSSQRVGSLAADPMASLKTIAAVTATNTIYDVRVSPDACNGMPAYHLTLAPRIQAGTHPLRELWILQNSFEVCGLTYAIPFNGGEATVRYAFENRGEPPIPFIVKISARMPYRTPIGTRYTDFAEEVQDIAFPTQVPGL
jgi:erythromycin esterase-like protein